MTFVVTCCLSPCFIPSRIHNLISPTDNVTSCLQILLDIAMDLIHGFYCVKLLLRVILVKFTSSSPNLFPQYWTLWYPFPVSASGGVIEDTRVPGSTSIFLNLTQFTRSVSDLWPRDLVCWLKLPPLIQGHFFLHVYICTLVLIDTCHLYYSSVVPWGRMAASR